MLCSFVVFDTVITRITAMPQGIFALMQEQRNHNDISVFVKILCRCRLKK